MKRSEAVAIMECAEKYRGTFNLYGNDGTRDISFLEIRKDFSLVKYG